MRVFSVGSWAHFGSLVVSLAMLGFGLTSAVMSVAKDWFSRHWRWRASVALGLFGPLAVGANLYVQQLGFNAIFLVSDPAQKWKLLRDISRRSDAVPRRRGVPRLRVSEEQPHVRARLFRRSGRAPGSAVSCFCWRCMCFVPANLIAAPLALWLAACLAWAVGPGGLRHARSLPRRAAPSRSAAISSLAPALGLKTAGGQRLQGRLLRAQIPRREEGLRERVAVRLSRGLFELLSAFCAGALRQRRLQPADDARQRLSRPVYRQRRADRRSCAICPTRRRPISVSCRWSTPTSSRRRPRPSSPSSAAASRPRSRCTPARTTSRSPKAIGRCSTRSAARSSSDFTGDILSKVRVIDYEGRHFLAAHQ